MKTNLWLAVLFILPIALGLYWFAAPWHGPFGWMPPHINPDYGDEIDIMYIIIMVVVAVMFFLTEGLIVWFIFRFRAKEGVKAEYSHGSKKAELIWSIIPGLMLLALAIGQSFTWAKVRYTFPDENSDETRVVQVYGEQFAWNFRYSKDKTFGNDDDFTVRDMVIPVGKKILCNMSSKDVIHSLFIPHVRVKQDVVPGMMTQSWFKASHVAVWNLKTQKREFVTPEEFRKLKVASNWETPAPVTWVIDDFINKRIEHRKFSYKVENPDAPAQIWNDGKPMSGKAGDATHVLHFIDVACAELCGNNHFTMASKCTTVPQEMFDYWLGQGSKTDADKVFTDIWDKYYSHYNEK